MNANTTSLPSLSNAARRIAVHLALTPEWDASTLDAVAAILYLTALPDVGAGIGEGADFYVEEAQELGVWPDYVDDVREWAEREGMEMPVFQGERISDEESGDAA